MTAPKERPIRLYAHEVRAVLAGRQTQVRRVVKGDITTIGSMGYLNGQPLEGCSATLGQCPFGAPGDRLWVRETWGYFGGDEYLYQKERGSVGYRADHIGFEPIPGGRWRPSIHMPRWASRITLEITDVRAQRLQEISEEDAVAEGIDQPRCPHCGYTWSDCRQHMDHRLCVGTQPKSAVSAYRVLWDSIHGPGSWDANLWVWVWVLTFRRVER